MEAQICTCPMMLLVQEYMLMVWFVRASCFLLLKIFSSDFPFYFFSDMLKKYVTIDVSFNSSHRVKLWGKSSAFNLSFDGPMGVMSRLTTVGIVDASWISELSSYVMQQYTLNEAETSLSLHVMCTLIKQPDCLFVYIDEMSKQVHYTVWYQSVGSSHKSRISLMSSELLISYFTSDLCIELKMKKKIYHQTNNLTLLMRAIP